MKKAVKYNTYDFNKPVSERVSKLRDDVIHSKPILCSERALIITELYKKTEDQPKVTRRALALQAILDNMTQNIWEGELIVGSHGSNGRRSAPVFPEYAIEWLDEELDEMLETREQDTFIVPEKVKSDLKMIFPYWYNKTIYKKYRAMLPEETKNARDTYMFTRDLFERSGYGHTAYDIDKLLKVGLIGIKKEIEVNMKELDLSKNEDLDKKLFYEGVIISIDAVINYAKRYARKALDLAGNESNTKRKEELLKIADVCNWVPEHPARDIWDAVQMVAFMQIVIQTETNGDSVSPGRLDQYFYPYYVKDVKSGAYTIDQIQELLDCLWIKFNEIVKVQDSESIHIHPGFPMTPNLTIGGVTPEGDDATNELSYLMLNTQKHVRLTNPQFTARFHENTTDDFKMRVAEIIELGTGMPAIFGDSGCMEAIQNTFPDMPIERVRDYSIVGCIELAPRGFQGRVNGGFLNVARVVDLALNDGIDRLTNTQIGPNTGKPDELIDYDSLLEAVRTQMAYFVKQQVINAAIVDKIQRENTPHLFLSSLIEGCVESGQDMTWGGSLWGATPILHVGLATASNAITAVKKCVFEDASISMSELKSAMDADYSGEKGKQVQELLLSSPKYGNDDDYADHVIQMVTEIFFDEIEKHSDLDGRPYSSMILTLGATVPHGWKTGATADGRNSTMPVSDSMSPSNLGESAGPTAVLLSASKIDQKRVLQGNVLNLKLNKTAIRERESKEKMMDLVSTYFNTLKGQEVQFNVVDGKVLRDAQENPENYKDLIIRIAGYSARFIELAKELQDDIIAREEHVAI